MQFKFPIQKALLLILSTVSINSYSQAVVSFEGIKVAYVGWDNPIKAMVAGRDCSEISISVDNGAIKNEGNCNYTFNPTKTGKTVFTLTLKKDKKKTWKCVIPSIKVPPPAIFIGRYKEGDSIPLKALIAQKGVTADLASVFNLACLEGVTVRIDSFSIGAFRNSEAIFSYKNAGPTFTEEMAKQFSSLQAKDKLILFDIHYSFQKSVSLNKAIEFTITN